jgi:hypothetical protein
METMATVLASLERVVARGSAFYNAGQSDLCARLYFQAVQQVAQVLATMGETDAAAYLADVLRRASQIVSASDAAWFLRGGIEQLVGAVRASPTYASLFAVVDEVRATPDVTCAYGLAIQRVGSEVRVYELRCSTECDDELDDADAIFFVELADSSSSSDSDDSEFEFEIEIVEVDGDDELGDGADNADNNGELDREPLYVDDDVSSKPLKHHRDDASAHSHMFDSSSLLVRCGISLLVFLTLLLLLMTAYRRRQLRLRMRAIAAMEEQQKQRLQRVFGQHGAVAGGKCANVVPMNTPYAAFV